MKNYQDLIKKLLSYQLSIDSDQFCLSLYQPNQNYSKLQIFEKLKPLLEEGIRANKQLKKANNKEELINVVKKKLLSLDNLFSGLALFVVIKSSNRGIEFQEKDLFLVPLTSQPIRENQLAKRFKIDQLIMIIQEKMDVLILEIKRNEYNSYLFAENTFQKIDLAKNTHIEKDVNRYLQEYKSKNLDMATHSTGKDKFKKHILKQNELFLQDITRKMKSYAKFFNPLLIVYSNWFEPFAKNFFEKLDKELHNTSIITLKKVFKNRITFKKEVKKVIDKYKEKEKMKLLEEIKDKHYDVVKTWSNIVQAARNGQIRKLLIRPNLSVTGYVSDRDKLIYIKKPKVKAKKIDNIIPWLIIDVIKKGGKIKVFTQEEYEGQPYKLAQLKYIIKD